MKKIKQLMLVFAFAAGVSAAVLPVGDVAAINVFKACNGATSQVCSAQGNENATSMAQKVTTTLLFILGIISVIMIIVGGIRYTTSNGDASRVKAAKDTITYSVVGLVVALLAYSIVTFVANRF
jgi:glucose uptake protein GlcU